MKNIKGITVNHINGEIIIAKGFAKLAGIHNTPEYILLSEIRNENPSYKIKSQVIRKPTGKKTHKGLNLTLMEKVVAQQENIEAARAEFENVKNFYQGHCGYYAKVKAWFLEKYPNYNKYADAA